MNYQDLVNEFAARPREVPTAPVYAAAPRWFSVTAREGAVFVSSGREHAPACRIRGERRLNPEEFPVMLSLYRRRQRGQRVSREAGEVSINQSYWYGIFRELRA